ncbi:MAG: hypothetical protein LBL46_03495 [Rickettsiales bacterium]|jgi:hypothetical protein|nr:hypothetical protein [Rickettsiales bacterium]
MLEMLFALLIAGAAMPMAYRQMSNIGRDLEIVGAAKDIISRTDPIRNFIRLRAADLPADEFVEIESGEADIRVFMLKSKDGVAAFAIFAGDGPGAGGGDILKSQALAHRIGMDAAVAEPDGMAYSAVGNWAVEVGENAQPGDVVVRVRTLRQNDDTAKYLHRMVLSEAGLSTMKRDFSMGGFAMTDVGSVDAKKLTATGIDAYLVKTPVIATDSLYFMGGLNLNPEKSVLTSVRAQGDAVGFRNLYTDNFQSPRGEMTADRASVAQSLVVANKFEVKSSYSRTASGFAGMTAKVIKTSYLDAGTLRFMPGFGLTISGELLRSDQPVKIGSWAFPNTGGTGPKFSELVLGGRSVSGASADFSEVLEGGWR